MPLMDQIRERDRKPFAEEPISLLLVALCTGDGRWCFDLEAVARPF